MRIRVIAGHSTPVALATAIALFLALWAIVDSSAASAADGSSSARAKKQTMIYHGNGFAIEPANLYNWEYDGHQSGMTGGQDISGLKGQSTKHFPDGVMTWKRWDRRSAVGIGGLHTHCGTLPKAKCKKSPWYGTPRVRVYAYGLESGHFSKMKVTRLGKGPKQFMVLEFVGKHLTPAWKITREVVSGWDASRVSLSGRR